MVDIRGRIPKFKFCPWLSTKCRILSVICSSLKNGFKPDVEEYHSQRRCPTHSAYLSTHHHHLNGKEKTDSRDSALRACLMEVTQKGAEKKRRALRACQTEVKDERASTDCSERQG